MTAATGLRLLRAADYRRMPWRNGLGETTEIAIEPAGAALDAFDWRVSMARVDSAGPFSTFAGVDRTLSVLDGAGLRLVVDGAAPVELTPQSAPHAFAGDRASSATLLGAAVTDLNVMSRRDRLRHRVRRLALDGPSAVGAEAALLLLLCAAGSVRVGTGTATLALGPLDAVLGAAPGGTLVLSADAPAELFVIEFEPLRTTAV